MPTIIFVVSCEEKRSRRKPHPAEGAFRWVFAKQLGRRGEDDTLAFPFSLINTIVRGIKRGIKRDLKKTKQNLYIQDSSYCCNGTHSAIREFPEKSI
jgi:hypothetical protein